MGYTNKVELSGDDYLSRHICELPSAKSLGIGTQYECDDASCSRVWELKNRLGDYNKQIDWSVVYPKQRWWSAEPAPQYVVSSALTEEDKAGMVHNAVDGWVATGSVI